MHLCSIQMVPFKVESAGTELEWFPGGVTRQLLIQFTPAWERGHWFIHSVFWNTATFICLWQNEYLKQNSCGSQSLEYLLPGPLQKKSFLTPAWLERLRSEQHPPGLQIWPLDRSVPAECQLQSSWNYPEERRLLPSRVLVPPWVQEPQWVTSPGDGWPQEMFSPISLSIAWHQASLIAQLVKNPPAVQ